MSGSKQNLYLPLSIIIAGALIAGVVFISNKTETPQTASIAETVEKVGNNLEITTDDHIRGDIEASVTIIEFSDFQCPYCSRFHETMKKAMEEYPGKVKWVYKHFPLDSIHPYARKAAEASECANEQNKFWEYADRLFENQSNINPSIFEEIAQNINLDVSEFSKCLDSGKYKNKVEKDYQEGIKVGIRGTPGGFINDQVLGGALPYEQLKAIIESLI